MVEQALATVPAGFRAFLEGVVVDIEPVPSDEVCRELDLRDPRSLLGLYRGTPLPNRHVAAPYRYPDRIVIYQRNIERICRSRKQMVEQVRKTVLHEVGHHFGLTEKQLREMGYG